MVGINNVFKRGEKLSNDAANQVGKVVALQERIIERLNWVMRSQQQIADHLKIKLKDPLED